MNSTAPGCAAQDDNPYLLARSGAQLRLRPATPTDGPLIAEFFRRLAPEDLRFRFLDGGKPPRAVDIDAMLNLDPQRDRHILGFDTATGQLIASMMILAEPREPAAEVAIAVATEWKGRGIGWTLLHHAISLGRMSGLKKLRSIEFRTNCEALDVERALGFRPIDANDDPNLVLMELDLA